MASIGELLHHLVEHAPGLYEDGKRLFHDVIDAEFPPKPESTGPEAVSRETAPETPPAAPETTGLDGGHF